MLVGQNNIETHEYNRAQEGRNPMQNNTNGINDKRLILVVEDEAVNRAILGSVLEKDYEVIYAGDGTEALRMASENKTVLSLIILDLIMPGMQGQEVLRRVRADSEYQDIPVIVASGDQSQEIECLNAGASDFIQKPYPEHGVILARVRRTIELFEGRKIIHSTERDPLTGLYNREFFFSYAEQYDQHHRDTPMDAIVLVTKHHRLRTTDLFALTAVGARSPKSKWQQCPVKAPGASFQACCSLRSVMAQPRSLPPASCHCRLCVWASVSSSQWEVPSQSAESVSRVNPG